MASRSIVSACAIVVASFLVSPPSCAAPAAAALSTYRTWASAQAELLARMTRMLTRDIADGDLEAARNDYAPTHRYLERIRPLLAAQGELAERIDGAAADFRDRERDPAFSGFHRIEYGLYVLKSLQGLAAVADRLNEDTLRLRDAVATQPISTALLDDGPAALVETVSAHALDGGREPYAHTDLWDIEADLDGARAMLAALQPEAETRDPLALARISVAFARTSERLSSLRDGCGFKAYDKLTAAEKAGLEETTASLGHELASLRHGASAPPGRA